MATFYLPSGGLAGLPPYWYIRGTTPDDGDFGRPTVADGVIHFDWSVVPSGFQGGRCGLVNGGGVDYDIPDSTDFHLYNLAIPNRGGRVAFTVTLTTGPREQVSFNWSIGDLSWTIRQGRSFNDQRMTSSTGPGVGLAPWSGSCSYLLWFPDGIDQPARLDFDGGSCYMPPGTFGRYDDISLLFSSGGASTLGIFPAPPPPKTAQGYVSNVSVESWDPDRGAYAYPWAVAVDGAWHGTNNLVAGAYLDGTNQVVVDWSSTATQRLGAP